MIKRHLALHLTSSHPSVEVNTFPSFDSDEFKEYLHISPIHFVMGHDGVSTALKSTADITEDDEQYAKILLRGMIWYFNTHKLNVALINRIEFRDSKIFTMIVESFTPLSKLKLAMTARFVHEIKYTRKLLEDSQRTSQPKIATELKGPHVKEVMEAFSEEDVVPESYYLAAYGVSRILKHKDFDVFLPSAFILHNVLLKQLPLSQRRLPLVTFDDEFEEQIETFLRKISDISRCWMDDSEWQEFAQVEEIESDIIDLIDGRLFRVVIQAMCDNSFNGQLPKAARQDWEILRRVVAKLAGDNLSLAGSIEPESSGTTATESDFESVSEDLAVLPFSNSVFDKHLACIHVETDASLPARLGVMKIYRETTHWHNHRKPLNPKLAPAQKVSKWRYAPHPSILS